MNLLTLVPLVIDFETTGIDPEKDRAIEVAAIAGNQLVVSLINPGRDIPCTASAVHHIIAEDVRDSPSWPTVKGQILAMDFDVIVAHNAVFDAAFFAHDGGLPKNKPVICTWRMAKKLLPDAPSYSNMALNYFLGLGRPSEAHRALADAVVTEKLFRHLLGLAAARATDPENVPLDKFLAWMEAPIMEKTINFGKYRGEKWVEIAVKDPGYLKWVLEKSDVCAKNPDTKFTIQKLLNQG